MPRVSGDEVIDVERLVEELRGRVAQRRAAGDYADDFATIPLELPAPEPAVRFRPELAYSTKPGVGRALTLLKRGILRLLIHVFDDLARQTDAAVAAVAAETRASTAETRRQNEEALAAETDAREASDRGALERIATLEQQLARLQLGPRLARLERERRAVGGAAEGLAPVPAPAVDAAPLDYLAFEARFRGSEDVIRERQRAYQSTFAGCRRVVDLGCGRGELVQLLVDTGIAAYGVEVNDDFVDLVASKGLEVVREDALAHLAGLAPGDVDGIVASHVVEHLPPAVVTRLVETAHDLLPEGGVLALETPNPESLVAGSVNFHRDPTHLRPVHPDTLAFICESAGFSEVRIERMSPVPAAERLPAPTPGGGEVGEHLDRIVERLNALIYGFQDYAVVARR